MGRIGRLNLGGMWCIFTSKQLHKYLMYFKRKESWFQSMHLGTKIFMFFFAGVMLTVAGFLLNKIYTTDKNVTHFYFLPLLLGLVFELRRITNKWSTVAVTTIISFYLSFFAFARSKTEGQYSYEGHIQMWPYFFLMFFVVVAMIAYLFTEKVKVITEGITLLFTIAFNYWILANGYFYKGNFLIKGLIIASIIPSLFTIYNALSYQALSKKKRMLLSLWFAIIGLILAVDNCYHLYQMRNAQMVAFSTETWFLFFQYFLLGTSGIYIVQNLLMVGSYFLPSRGYGDMLSEVHSVHLKRFSSEQVYVIDALIVVILSVSLFTLNYIYQFVPINFMIWAIVSTMSALLYIVHKIIA